MNHSASCVSTLALGLAAGALLTACGTEPEPGITGTLAASQTSNFSDWSHPVSLGPVVSSPFSDQFPSVSKDGLSLYFGSNRGSAGQPGGIDIWVAQRDCLECPWGEPLNLGAAVNASGFNDNSPRLSRDGHWLFFNSLRTEGSFGASDIWVSYRDHVHDDFAWAPAVNLGSGVNTAAVEGGASFLENEETAIPQLYFSRGGDIHVSELAADGSWSPATPVVELSDPGADDGSPSISPSGLDIYFTSNRSGVIHVWTATRQHVLDPWSPPVELGLSINSSSAIQSFFHSHGQTETLYFSRVVPGALNDLFVSTRTRGGQD